MNLSLTRPLLLVLALFCATAGAEERTFDRQVDAPIGGHLTADLDMGSVSIAGTDAHQVTVRAKVSGSDDGISRVSIHMERDGTGVRVRERYDHDSFWGWFWGSNPHVKFTIEVPRDYPVEIKTNGGSLELASLHAGAHGTTNGGSITVRDVQGYLTVHTMGGGISAEHLQGPTELITMGGGIEARDVRGDLVAHTMGGSITLRNIDGKVSAHTSGGGVSAEEIGDHDVTLETNGGSITLKMPTTAHASIDASTFGGSVRSDIPVSIESAGHSFLRGSLNGAGHTIRLHTNGGGIYIGPEA